MSDVMLFGVLRMPYEMAMGDELSRFQFWQRAQEAANRIDAYEAALGRLMKSDAGIATATDDDLAYAINDVTADPIVREQAAAVSQARAALADAPDHTPAIGKMIGDAPVQEGEAKDAARYRWLRPRLSAADFSYGDPPHPVLIFDWPANVGVGGNCDMNIDAARASTKGPGS